MSERLALDLGAAAGSGGIEGRPAHPRHPAAPNAGTGSAGDFDFLAGRWSISNRRLKPRWTAGADAWEELAGEAICHTVLGGLGSIEELRIRLGQPRGLGIRLLDAAFGVWSDCCHPAPAAWWCQRR